VQAHDVGHLQVREHLVQVVDPERPGARVARAAARPAADALGDPRGGVPRSCTTTSPGMMSEPSSTKMGGLASASSRFGGGAPPRDRSVRRVRGGLPASFAGRLRFAIVSSSGQAASTWYVTFA
jgi:hypothetical protein